MSENPDPDWIVKATAKAKASFTAKHKKAFEHETALPVWLQTATSANTRPGTTVSKYGAAILPHVTVPDSKIPRIGAWQTICRRIMAQVSKGVDDDFLIDIAFQHHRSTNGRWNPALKRWERWAVRPVSEWLNTLPSDVTYDDVIMQKRGERTFRRIRTRLVDLGLIDAEVHMWQGIKCLWIKPTELLSRILFEAGFWEQQRHQLFPASPAEAPIALSTGKKPRGISAKISELNAAFEDVYKTAQAFGYSDIDKQERWEIFRLLTEPMVITPNYTKKPYVALGSKQSISLHWSLFLSAPA